MAKLIFDNQYFTFDSVTNAESATPTVTADASVEAGARLGWTVSGFGGTITTATLTDGQGNVLTLTSVNDTGGDVAALADEQQFCLFGTVTLTVGDGTSTDTDSTTLNVPSGFAVTTLASGFTTDAHSYLNNYGGTPAVGDQFVEGSANLTLYDDGEFEASTSGQYTIYAIDATDGYMQSFTLSVADVGGTAAHQAATATQASSGVVADVVGSGSHQAATATQSASGTIAGIDGTANHQAQRATQVATGARVIAGTGFTSASRASQEAAGAVNKQTVTGTGAHQASTATQTALGGFLLDTPIQNTKIKNLSTTYSVKAA